MGRDLKGVFILEIRSKQLYFTTIDFLLDLFTNISDDIRIIVPCFL